MLPTFRELSTRSKVLAVGCSALLVAGLATATVIAARASTPGPPPPSATGGRASALARQGAASSGGSAPAKLLPGAQTWHDGASSYIFGTNDTIDYAEPAFSSLPSVQSEVKQGGLTLDRIWGYDDDSDATIEQKVAAAQNAGMQCYFMLGSTDDLAWMEHVVSMLGSKCNMYEFGNEPDAYNSVAGGHISTDTSEWIADVPKLRVLNPTAVFGGPAVQYPTSSDGSQGSYPSDIAYFLAKTAAARVRADFISYHDYPCNGYSSQSACLAHTTQAFAQDQSEVLAWEQTYYGDTVPTGISEYNFDPGSSTLGAWGGDSTFMYDWTSTAIDAFVANHFAFAMQFTSLNHSGYGNLDMFSDSAPYEPRAQFYGVVSQVEKYGGPSTLAIPNPLP